MSEVEKEIAERLHKMDFIKPSPDYLEASMREVECIRNVCILAHVDHGKTTIADALLATNRLVSKRQAGKLRYLDDRLDEQQRGITMKSSGISLLNIIPTEEGTRRILLNLIDTPGHIDFSAEVSAAIRVSDGALIVVDLVEGVCAQTKKCMQQAYEERTKMILVLNKFDRLCTELNKTHQQIFEKILRIIEDCNAYIAELYQYDWAATKDIEKTGLLFNPVVGNVIFASGTDGWAFTLRDIAQLFLCLMYDTDLDDLTKKIWDFDCYSDHTGHIFKGAIRKRKQNLFVALAIKTVSQIYESVVLRRDRESVGTICERLNIKHVNRYMVSNDPKVQIAAIMNAWQPIAVVLLRQIYFLIPAPNEIPYGKLEYLLNTDTNMEDSYLANCISKNMLPAFDDVTNKRKTYCYVSKMFCVNKSNLSQNKPRMFVPDPRSRPMRSTADLPQNLLEHYFAECSIREEPDNYPMTPSTSTSGSLAGPSRKSATVVLDPKSSQTTTTTTTESSYDTDDDSSTDVLDIDSVHPDKVIQNHLHAINSQVVVIALARVYTGQLKVGDSIYVLQSDYKPCGVSVMDPETYVSSTRNVDKVTITELYMLYGRDLIQVDTIPAGNFCGIGGLRQYVNRTATLTTELESVPFVSRETTAPIVRNVIEPVNVRDLPILRNGLKLLMLSDPCVEVMIQESGELVLITAGDVHLAKCVEDLKNTFAKVEFQVSVPQISLKETVINEKWDWSPDDTLSTTYFSMNATISSLPADLGDLIRKHHDILRIVQEHQNLSFSDFYRVGESTEEGGDLGTLKTFVNERLSKAFGRAIDELKAYSEEAGKTKDFMKLFYRKLWSVSKSKDNLNLLVNNTDYRRNIFIVPPQDDRNVFVNTIIKAFDKFCKSGPICEEPVVDCIFIVNEFKLLEKLRPEDVTAQIVSQIESFVKSVFRQAFERVPNHLMEPMFYTEVQVNTSILGKVYTVVNRRNGKILDAMNMDDQEKKFLVKALIPVICSDGLANDFRKTTSGQALPTLSFSHFEIVEGDPYYQPKPGQSEEEDEDVTAHLRAVELRKEVRRRKGLPVEDQVVVHAEKQRTLNKKK